MSSIRSEVERARRALLSSATLYSRAEVLALPCPVPKRAGVYGWYFRAVPLKRRISDGCARRDGLTLLYVGTAPSGTSGDAPKISKSTLRSRIRTHYRGNASGSTLRLTLGCLLGYRMQKTKSGRRTFGQRESDLSHWMDKNAFVDWYETDAPWDVEPLLIHQLDLPLNLSHNGNHPFCADLKLMRSEAKNGALPFAPAT